MASPSSSTVSQGETATAAQYNALRADILAHTHDGTFGVALEMAKYAHVLFGTGADGVFEPAENTDWASPGDAWLVKEFEGVTIPSGVTVCPDGACRGVVIKVRGDVSISGTLHVDGMALLSGTRAQETIRGPLFGAGIVDTKTTGAVDIPLGGAGGAGGKGSTSTSAYAGADGGAAFTPTKYYGGATGSAGGGGGGAQAGGPTTGSAATDTGGAVGGNGASGNSTITGSGGGGGGRIGGSPGGGASGAAVGSAGQSDGGKGGGIIIIVVDGDVTVNASGIVRAAGLPGANGGDGGDGSSYDGGGGGGQGGGGGGVIIILYTGTYTNNGTVSAPGGAAGSPGARGTASTAAQAGASGTVITQKIYA